MNLNMFKMSHKELELLIVDLQNHREIVTNIYERYIVYECYRRYSEKISPLNLKWIQSTLKLSFPKVKKLSDNLYENGYLHRNQSAIDKRVIELTPTKKLIKGLELFEMMKVNELYSLKFKLEQNKAIPSLSELTLESIPAIKKEYIDEF